MAGQEDLPPSYSEAIRTRNGIPPAVRRSMEDEGRNLPEGWVRQFDVEQNHQYFVDTRADPPRSIWHHPFDDQLYLSTLDASEREHIQSLHNSPNSVDVAAESTDEEDHGTATTSKLKGPASSQHPHRSLQDESKSEAKPGLGRRWKDKLTNSTHEERVQRRKERAAEEKRAYEMHLAFRDAMNRAIYTGQPQLIGKDRNGHDLYIEPPQGPRNVVGGYPGQRTNGSSYNPYTQGVYSNPNARFIRPQGTYGRPYGYGYGGGLGVPLAAGLGGGLLLGGLLGAGL